METIIDLSAPMASAEMQYNEDGSVNWGDMWESYCLLASEGGPPHRGTLLQPPTFVDVNSQAYAFVTGEIARGIFETTGLKAYPADDGGWLAIDCRSGEQALWLAEAVEQENVAARFEDTRLFVPAGEGFSVKGEIKNVITAVSKTVHYWDDHLAAEVKSALSWQVRFATVKRRVIRLFGKS